MHFTKVSGMIAEWAKPGAKLTSTFKVEKKRRKDEYYEITMHLRQALDGQDLASLSRKELREARKDIGMIFQHFNLLQCD